MTVLEKALYLIKKIFLLTAVVFCVLPHLTQAVTESTLGGTLISTINPKHPRPGEVVNIKLSSYGYSLENSKISWFVNQKLQLEGAAKKEHVVTMGPNGSQTSVTILVENSAGKQIVKNLTFNPADVDLIWEADTYIPDDYQGAALPSLGSRVTVTAIPNLKETGFNIPANELIFTWTKDYKTIPNQSGRGKDSFSFDLNQPSAQIDVLVQSPNFKIEAYNRAIITAYEPELVLYPVKPLLGRILEAFNSSFSISPDMSGLQIEPYFVSKNLIRQGLVNYEWSSGGEIITSSNKNSVSLTQLSDQEKSNLSVRLTSKLDNSELSKKNWSVVLNKQNPFFGK